MQGVRGGNHGLQFEWLLSRVLAQKTWWRNLSRVKNNKRGVRKCQESGLNSIAMSGYMAA